MAIAWACARSIGFAERHQRFGALRKPRVSLSKTPRQSHSAVMIIADWWVTLQPWWHWMELLIQGGMFFIILAALRGSRLKLRAVVDDLGQKLERQIEAW
jgi:phosphatidylethanolamine-binding protein (PEBP) family uncharacterized protein